jgi:hypothetical protein
MQTNNRGNQNQQIPSEQGRAVEATASIKSLLESFFNETCFDEIEDYFSDLTQVFICSDEAHEFKRDYLANTVYSIRRVSNLLRKLEALNNQVKGGASC